MWDAATMQHNTKCAVQPPNHCRIPSKYYQHLPFDIMNDDLPVVFFEVHKGEPKC